MLFNIKFVVQFTLLSSILYVVVKTKPTDGVESQMKIFNGSCAVRHRYLKHIVSIVHYNLLCGGTILAPKVILSAAHCIKSGRGPKDVVICAGSPKFPCTSKTPMAQIRGAERVFIYPDYKNVFGGFDIAIFILKEALIEDGITVQRINIADQSTPIGTTCTIIGWGQTKCGDSNYTKFPSEAQYTELKIRSKTYCEKYTPYLPGMLCVSGANNISFPCHGDSGGPLICGGKAVGIASIGLGYFRPGSSTIYTDVFTFQSWINQILLKGKFVSRSISANVKGASVYFYISMFLLRQIF